MLHYLERAHVGPTKAARSRAITRCRNEPMSLLAHRESMNDAEMLPGSINLGWTAD